MLQAQSVNSKDASSCARCRRSSSPWRINRTDSSSRLPLISGIKPSEELMPMRLLMLINQSFSVGQTGFSRQVVELGKAGVELRDDIVQSAQEIAGLPR